MRFKRYKYYLKKPRTEIVKDILYWLLTAGAVYIAASSPYFIRNVLRQYRRWKKYSSKRLYDNFYQLRRRGLIDIRQEGAQIYISLTKEGKKRADYMQIDDLKIQKPKRWDGKWRLVIFDISELKKVHREAFRGKLKELGFRLLQKSAWIHPFDCEAEIELLRSFFGLRENDLRLILAEKIGDDTALKKVFSLE